MCRTYQDIAYDERPTLEDLNLGWFDRLKLRVGLPIYIGHYRLKGWSGHIGFYVHRCSDHGLYIDYPHGYDNYLSCKECRKESSNWRSGGASGFSDVHKPGCLKGSSTEDKEDPSQ